MQNFEIIVIDDRNVLDRLGTIATWPSPDFIRENFEQLSMSEGEHAAEEGRDPRAGVPTGMAG